VYTNSTNHTGFTHQCRVMPALLGGVQHVEHIHAMVTCHHAAAALERLTHFIWLCRISPLVMSTYGAAWTLRGVDSNTHCVV
jgi:hypothetical protein